MVPLTYWSLLLTLFNACYGEITTQSAGLYPRSVTSDYPPFSNAGSDVFLMLPADSVVLNGSGSTDDHGIVLYEWRRLSGAQLTMEGMHDPVLRLANLQPADYRFSLTVTDTRGQTDASFVNVKVIPRECPDPFILSGQQSPPHNGTYVSGDLAKFVCDAGYRALHTKAPVIHIQCSSEGRWVNIVDPDAPIPTCQISLSCLLPDIPYGSLLPRPGGYMVGDHAPVICKPGTSQQASSLVLLCQHDGSWTTEDGSHTLPRCQVESESCDKPEALTNGAFNILDGVQLINGRLPNGAGVFYYCNVGYELEPDDSSIARCQDGHWKPQQQLKPARCVAKPITRPPQSASAAAAAAVVDTTAPCPPPPHVPHARPSVYNTEIGTMLATGSGASDIVIYFCEDGYSVVREKTMRCENGAWRGPVPLCEPSPLGCAAPPSIPNGDYIFYNQRAARLGEMIEKGTQVYYLCQNGYKMKDKNISVMLCMDGLWEGEVAVCEKRTHCDSPMDIPNGNWIFSYLPYPDFRIGSKLIYECDNSYKAIGPTEIECLPSGYWSDYAPKCLPRGEYCSEPGNVSNGFYMCKPNMCAMFKVGTEVDYICSKDHEPQPNDVMAQSCLPGGQWSAPKPICAPVLSSAPVEEVVDGGITSSTLTVVTATTCSVLGMLILVLALVILQRHRLRPMAPSNPPPPAYQPDAELPRQVLTDQHDRVALIQFADGVQIALPSYEEAIRPHAPTTLHLSSTSSRLSSHRPSSLRSGDYRPLPSIPPSLRSSAAATTAPPCGERDHHRNSIITTASSNTRDNLSLAFGSMDTVNVSDGTSTSITIGTYDSSNPSLAMSQRATAGSLASASSNSLANEDAPLLEQRSSSTEPPPPAHHETTVSTPIDEEPDKE